jgi:signal transduction histidine kinase
VRAYLAAAREGIDRGIELTSLLLAFAKHQELDAHVGDVNEFLRSFAPFLRYGAGKDVRIKLELNPDVPTCLVDPALFDAAVLNLVVNARDAMADGGEIRIVTERLIRRSAMSGQSGLEVYTRVRIKDSGCGMSEEVLQQVFNPFFTTKGENGTGLGLSQVRAFMQMLGGDVSIKSKPGIGTTVDLLFPSSQACA